MHLPLGTNLTRLKTLENSYKSLAGNRCLAAMYEWDYWNYYPLGLEKSPFVPASFWGRKKYSAVLPTDDVKALCKYQCSN